MIMKALINMARLWKDCLFSDIAPVAMKMLESEEVIPAAL